MTVVARSSDSSASLGIKSDPSARPVTAWLFLLAAMVFAMAVIGAVTRLTQSGLSMVEWRPVIGALPPLTESDWQSLYREYQSSPEFLQVNAWMSIEDFRSIFWWEYVHRLWGRLIGIVFAGPFLYFLLRRRLPPRLAPGLGLVFALGALEGSVGWWMVASGLVDDPHVSHYRLATHLGIAVAIYGALLWTALGLVAPRARASGPSGLARAALAVAGLVYLTILSGALVAGLHAGLIDNTFPLMEGRLVPPDYLALGSSLDAILSNPTAVQFNHRVLALAAAASTIGFVLAAYRRPEAAPARPALALMGAAALLQVALGIATLLLVVPVPLATFHQMGALALFGLVLWAARSLAR